MYLNFKYRLGLFGLVLCGGLSGAQAQITTQAELARITEAEIQLQDKYMAAMVALQVGKKEAAAQLFQEILQKKNTCDACAFQLSRLYTAQNNPLLALEMAQKATQIDPENVWYQWAFAEALERAGRDKEAIEIYKKLLSKSSDMANTEELSLRLAAAFVRLAEPAKAIKVLDDLERVLGLDYDLTDKKVVLYEAMGAENKAAQEWRKLADSAPRNIDFQRAAANYFVKIKDKAGAKIFFDRILAVNPNDAQAVLALSADKKKGSGDVAILQGFEANFANPNLNIDDKIKVFLPYVDKIASGKAPDLGQQALSLAEILEKTHPNEPKALALLGDLQYQTGRTEQALQTYRRCNVLNKRVFAVWEQQMRLEFELGLFADLAQSSEQAIDYFPSQAVAFFFWGLSADKKGDWPTAAEGFEQALLMSAKKPALKQEIAAALLLVYAKQKKVEKADAIYKDMAAEAAPMLSVRYAQALILRGGLSEARLLLDKVVAPSNMLRDGLLLEAIGDAFFALNERDRALEYWLRAREAGNISRVLGRKISEKTFFDL